MNGKDCGTIREDFEMTSREYSVCNVMLGYASPARETEFAWRVGCFMEAYKRIRDFPGPDMAELISEQTRTQAKDWDRRRNVIDKMLARAGYEPTSAEISAYLAERKAFADELAAHREKHGWNGPDDGEPVEIYRKRRHGKAAAE